MSDLGEAGGGGEMRSWPASVPSTTPAYTLPSYTFTGQYSYMDDPTTTSVAEGFGLMFYNARWYDPSLGRFAQADSIVPGGVQRYDRYAYANNSPLNFTDPTGHKICTDDGYCGGYKPNKPLKIDPKSQNNDFPPPAAKRVMSLLGLKSYSDYLIWADKNQDLAGVLLNAEAGDIVRFSSLSGSDTVYTDFMVVKYKDGYSFYDTSTRQLINTSAPCSADALAHNITGAAVFGQNDEGDFISKKSTEGFNITLPVVLHDGWNRAADGKGIVANMPTTETGLKLIGGTALFVSGVITPPGPGVLLTAMGGGIDLYTLLLDLDTTPVYQDQRPPRVP